MGNQPKFKLIDIVLLECSFKRNASIDFQTYNEAKNNLHLNVEKQLFDTQIQVVLTSDISIDYEQVIYVESKISIAARFEKVGEITEQLVDNFCNISAPAIIFPFIREAIASISVKAGIPTILIQPINFVEIANKKTEMQ